MNKHGKTESETKKFRSDAMVKPTYATRNAFQVESWYGHAMKRDDKNVAKEVTTMKVRVKGPRGGPRLRWMDRVRSDYE